jgi:hypothetical protein
MAELSKHTYEEIRDAVVDIILKRAPVSFEPNQWGSLPTGVAEVFARRETKPGQQPAHYSQCRLHPHDAELTRDVFWDLFRQGFITLGMNDSNPAWPFFRLSHFGQQTLTTQSPYRFHDTNSFLTLVKHEVPDISPAAIIYLGEAVSTFYVDCLLASSVMLGVAAEVEFLRLAEIAAKHPTHGPQFSALAKQHQIRQKITKFQECLKPLLSSLPYEATEDLETNFLAIQSVLRTARNDAGHATGNKQPQREQVYVYLQLFVPFARQLMRLRQALT